MTEQLTTREHLESLPSPYREWALENVKNAVLSEGLSTACNNIVDAINAFVWEITPQGHSFWQDVCTSLERTGKVPAEELIPELLKFADKQEPEATERHHRETCPVCSEFDMRYGHLPEDAKNAIANLQTDFEYEVIKRRELEEAMSSILWLSKLDTPESAFLIQGFIHTSFPHIQSIKP